MPLRWANALVELSDAGHFGFAEEPARFQQAVRAFLSALQDPPRTPARSWSAAA
jgi:pimeloyl-ACP methyl ester carboxylesterase